MTVYGNVHGAPGTGKTTWLTTQFVREVKKHGRDNVAMVSYTRAAGGEFAFRASTALGIRDSRSGLPYVGTIHALAYAALGRPPLVGAKEYGAFCLAEGIDPPRSGRNDDTALDLGDEDTSENEEGAVLRRIVAEARHRHIAVDVAAARHRDFSPDRMAFLAERYKAWKSREGLLDFEDLLVQGMRKHLPVKVLFADEAQDNSPLLWAVLDHWAEYTDLFIAAGDPWQAIYVFAGADPSLFRNRKGKWLSLEVSHRLTYDTAEYAKTVLRDGDWDDPLFDKWHGEQVELSGPSTLYLARTHKLLAGVRERLMREGEPFGDYTRKAPLRTVAADSYRTLTNLLDGQVVGWSEFKNAAQYTRRYMPAGVKPRRGIPAKPPYGSVSAVDADYWLGDTAIAREHIPNGEYFKAIEKQYGVRGLLLRPQTMIGTIHSAKGREADNVKLVASWGWLPSRSLREAEGRKREALVAYVATTRHRHTFELVEGGFGKRYPWPGGG